MSATYLIFVKITSTFMGVELYMSCDIQSNMNIIWNEIHNINIIWHKIHSMNIIWNEIGNNIPPLITVQPLLILCSTCSAKSFNLHKYIENNYKPYLYHYLIV